VVSPVLQAWLEQHRLGNVHDTDEYGWTALHHAAIESYEQEEAAAIFKELLKFSWQAKRMYMYACMSCVCVCVCAYAYVCVCVLPYI